MNQIIKFDIESSANKSKQLWLQRQKISVELVAELYKAKEFYSNKGNRSDLLTNVSKLNSFKDYILFTGILERTCYRWLERYIPEENKLLTYEEFKEKKETEKTQKQKEWEKKDKAIKVKINTGKESEIWDNSCQKEYEKRIDNENYEKRKKEIFEKHNPINNTKENIIEENNKIFENATNIINEIKSQKEMYKKRYSSLDNIEEVYHVIESYIENLENDSLKLEAANSITKFSRDIGIKYQQKSIK